MVRRRLHLVSVIVCLMAVMAGRLLAQQVSAPSPAPVPSVMRLAGTFRPTNNMPITEFETVTFSIYAGEGGQSPLWQETQQVRVDPDGRYVILLGSASAQGLPRDL